MDKTIEHLDEVTIRFAGDSGDGMQLAGKQFSDTSASTGFDVNTFPDFPSEIRAPEGTLYGVSAFQIHLGSKKINTHGDDIDVLVAMNASSLKVNLPNLKPGGFIIANTNGFTTKTLELAKYQSNPLEDGSLNDYRVLKVAIEDESSEAIADITDDKKVVKKIKNLFALGITYWLFDRPLEPTANWLKDKFGKKPQVLEANLRVLQAGWNFANKNKDSIVKYEMGSSKFEKGLYRNITGNNAVALAMVASGQKAKLPVFLGSYPITPATDILQYISEYKKYGIRHLQAEDEIAGIASAIGAAYGGNLSFTTTSGPGLSLKKEAIGLAIMTELPLVIVDVMRAGPSTGLPTKPEQSDLYQAMYGRHGEAPLAIVAAKSPADCFNATVEASRIALKYMTPVIVLSDGYIAQGSEPWKIPTIAELPEMEVTFADDPKTFQPYKRNPETLARMWAIPGMKGMEHRIGGLEKQDGIGIVSHDPMNHQKMCELRQQKIDKIVVPDAEIHGPQSGNLLVIGWGSTYGAIKTAFDNMSDEGRPFSYVHLTHLNPLPKNLGDILNKFDKILLPEMNLGQLKTILQAKFLKPIIGLSKIQGSPFRASEVQAKIEELMENKEVKS